MLGPFVLSPSRFFVTPFTVRSPSHPQPPKPNCCRASNSESIVHDVNHYCAGTGLYTQASFGLMLLPLANVTFPLAK